MDQENPTTGDSGASITDRLERFLAADDAPDQPNQAPATQEAQPDETAATEPVKPVEGVAEEVEQPQISTSVLAKFLGIEESMLDVGEDGSPIFKTKIDGQEVPAKFADFLKDYQIRGHAENKAREAAEAHKALEAKTREAEQHLAQRFQQAEELLKLAANDLLSEYQGIDWKALEQHPDQGAVAALKIKYRERGEMIASRLQGVNQQKAQFQEKSKAEAEAARQEIIKRESVELQRRIPEWKDPVVRSREDAEMAQWARNKGFTDEEMGGFLLAHHIEVMRDAWQWNKQQQSKPAIENKVRTAPKLAKPGQAAPTGKAQQLQGLKSEVRKSGGKNGSLEAYLLASGKV